jgi:hypothetical protein
MTVIPQPLAIALCVWNFDEERRRTFAAKYNPDLGLRPNGAQLFVSACLVAQRRFSCCLT